MSKVEANDASRKLVCIISDISQKKMEAEALVKAKELAEAAVHWRYSVQQRQSLTDPHGRILALKAIQHA